VIRRCSRRRRGLRRRLPRARTSSAAASTSRSSCTPAPAPTSAARRPRCSTRSRVAAASRGCKPPFPAVAGLYASPDRGQQRRVDRVRPAILRATGADWFAKMGTEKSKGFTHLLAVRPREEPRPVRGAAGHHAARAARARRRRARPGHELKFWTPGGSSTPISHRRAPRRAARLRGRGGGRLDARHPKALQIFDETTSVVRRLRWTSSTSTSPAASARRAARARTGSCRSWSGSSRQGHREDDIDKLLDICDNMGPSFCALGDGATSCVTSPSSTSATSSRRAARSTPAGTSAAELSDAVPKETTGAPHDRHHEGTRPSSRSVTLTIDGIEVSVPKGTLVIRAAELLGIADPAVLRPPAARPGRRLPPVPGRGRWGPLRHAKPQASCTTTVMPRAWSSRPSSPRRSPTRRSAA
jgi:hypothetical protein